MSQPVMPTGPAPCDWAIVRDTPSGEAGERLIRPLVKTYAGLDTYKVYQTHFCKHTVGEDEVLNAEEIEQCTVALLDELSFVEPKAVLALGPLSAKALLGPDFTVMEACTGSKFGTEYGYTVTPSWHPGISLRPGGEDKLQHVAVAIGQWRHGKIQLTFMGPRTQMVLPAVWGPVMAIDTEGTPDDPRILSWAMKNTSGVVYKEHWPIFFKRVAADCTLIFHNALWDWKVLEAMGWSSVTQCRYCDTMERAYTRGEPSQGLKNLAWRYLRRHRAGYEDVVRPYWENEVVLAAKQRIEAGTTTLTHSPKTGKPLKKPKVILADDVKPLMRAIKNINLLGERMMMPLDMKYVPQEELETYARQDAEDTYDLAEAFGMIK